MNVGSHLRSDLGLNSYDYMALLDELESQMQVQVDMDAVMNAQTVADIIAALKQARGDDGRTDALAAGGSS